MAKYEDKTLFDDIRINIFCHLLILCINLQTR